MSQHRALAYAEDKLGVHRVWTNAEQLVVQLQEAYRVQAGFEAEARDLAFQIERRKQVILIDESKAGAAMTVAALERHIKLAQAGDEELTKLQELHNTNAGHRDRVSADIRGAENNLKAHNARMNELGGYFEYLASAKHAQIAVANAVNDGYPW